MIHDTISSSRATTHISMPIHNQRLTDNTTVYGMDHI